MKDKDTRNPLVRSRQLPLSRQCYTVQTALVVYQVVSVIGMQN